MKKYILIILALISSTIFAQKNQIQKNKVDYDLEIKKLEIQFKGDLKRLSPKNYSANKRELEELYNKKRSALNSERVKTHNLSSTKPKNIVKKEVEEEEEYEEEELATETIENKADLELVELYVDSVKNVVAVVKTEDNNIYNTNGIEIKPDFPGGMEKFYKYVNNNYKTPEEEGLKGKVYVTFVVEKDGSLGDIKVIRDLGYGTGAEAVRVMKSCPRWISGEQGGKKVRVLYSLPITVQSSE